MRYEAVLEHAIEREALQAELEQDGVVLQVVELGAGDLGRVLEVEEAWPGVDTIDDLRRVEQLLAQRGDQLSVPRPSER